MRECFILSFMLSTALSGYSQSIGELYYWIELKDKKESLFNIKAPEHFLSSKALVRRKKFNIPITESDLPISNQYLQKIEAIGGQKLHCSKWLNGLSIQCNTQQIEQIKQLPFVRSVNILGPVIQLKRKKHKEINLKTKPKIDTSSSYGKASRQIEMLKGNFLHKLGYKGKNIQIAVLDGGFRGVQVLPLFDSLRQRNGIGFTRDFINSQGSVYEASSHGMKVLSIMAANIPGFMVGTSPAADFICIRTENAATEYQLEECSWIAGLEYADSIGADIINSSVGYSNFNGLGTEYSKADLDGQTSLISKAAQIGFEKGLIIVTSAGNLGLRQWRFIDMPSDASDIIAVAAVDKQGQRASFSSTGLPSRNAVKPEIAAMGKGVYVATPSSNSVMADNGTSLAAPLISGLIACLWEAFPERTNKEIAQALFESASQFENPNNYLGYGIPDFEKAYKSLKGYPSMSR